jgi:chorismate lyase / 3-hydroxybenzoate synthase
MLGARLLAPHGSPVADATFDFIRAELLAPREPTLDAWFTSGSVRSHEHGQLRYATDGQWLHGHARIDDRQVEGGLRAATQRVYAQMFGALGSAGCPHLLRLWNYFSDINEDSDGLERYRHFNVGRQQAFLDAKRSAFEGAPAACALGTQSGALHVYFLAGRNAPVAIENPRQVSAYRYPDQYGPRTPTFSRAALADAGGGRQALFISGTASIVEHKTVHVGDVRRQTQECLRNIDAVLRAAAQHARQPFDAAELSYTINVRRRDHLAVVREVFEATIGAQTPAARNAVYLWADICRADLLVEVEAHGFARGGAA